MIDVNIFQIIEIVLVFFVLYGLAQIGLALLNMITNAIDLVTVKIVTKGKKISSESEEPEYQSTSVIGFQVPSGEEEEYDDEEVKQK